MNSKVSLTFFSEALCKGLFVAAHRFNHALSGEVGTGLAGRVHEVRIEWTEIDCAKIKALELGRSKSRAAGARSELSSACIADNLR